LASGWCFRTSLRYALRTSSAEACLDTPSSSYGSLLRNSASFLLRHPLSAIEDVPIPEIPETAHPARTLLHALAFFLRRTLRPLRRLKRCRSRLIFYFSFNVPVMLAHISSTAAYLSPACCVQHVSHRWSGVSSKMRHASSSALNPDFRLRIGSQTLRADNRRCRSRIEHSEQMDPHAKWLYRVVESSKKEGEANSEKTSIGARFAPKQRWKEGSQLGKTKMHQQDPTENRRRSRILIAQGRECCQTIV